MTDGKNIFDHPVTSNVGTQDKICEILAGQGDDCTTGPLLDYNYFHKHNKMIAIDLS